MAVDSSTIGGLLKQVYDSRDIEDLENKVAKTFKTFGKAPGKPTGQGWFTAVNVQGNQAGQKSQNELEALADPGNQVSC